MGTETLREALDVPTNWGGVDLADCDHRIYRLPPAEVKDLEDGLATVLATGKRLEAVTREEFPLAAVA